MAEWKDTATELKEKADAAIEASDAVTDAEARLEEALTEVGDVLNDLGRLSCTRHGFWLGWVGDDDYIEMQIREQDSINLDAL